MLTTNLPFEEWVEIMGSERLTRALPDRLTHRVRVIEANGPSYRLKEPKRRRPARRIHAVSARPAHTRARGCRLHLRATKSYGLLLVSPKSGVPTNVESEYASPPVAF